MIEMFLVFCLVVGKITVMRAEVEEEKKGGASAAPTTLTLHPASYWDLSVMEKTGSSLNSIFSIRNASWKCGVN
jgi:hypothetical protein